MRNSADHRGYRGYGCVHALFPPEPMAEMGLPVEMMMTGVCAEQQSRQNTRLGCVKCAERSFIWIGRCSCSRIVRWSVRRRILWIGYNDSEAMLCAEMFSPLCKI